MYVHTNRLACLIVINNAKGARKGAPSRCARDGERDDDEGGKELQFIDRE